MRVTVWGNLPMHLEISMIQYKGMVLHTIAIWDSHYKARRRHPITDSSLKVVALPAGLLTQCLATSLWTLLIWQRIYTQGLDWSKHQMPWTDLRCWRFLKAATYRQEWDSKLLPHKKQSTLLLLWREMRSFQTSQLSLMRHLSTNSQASFFTTLSCSTRQTSRSITYRNLRSLVLRFSIPLPWC